MAFRMPFGKYKGTSIEHVPHDYLRWFIESVDDFPDVVAKAKEVLESQKEYESEEYLEQEADKILKRYGSGDLTGFKNLPRGYNKRSKYRK